MRSDEVKIEDYRLEADNNAVKFTSTSGTRTARVAKTSEALQRRVDYSPDSAVLDSPRLSSPLGASSTFDIYLLSLNTTRFSADARGSLHSR